MDVIDSLKISESSKKVYISTMRRMIKDEFVIPSGEDEEVDRVKEYI